MEKINFQYFQATRQSEKPDFQYFQDMRKLKKSNFQYFQDSENNGDFVVHIFIFIYMIFIFLGRNPIPGPSIQMIFQGSPVAAGGGAAVAASLGGGLEAAETGVSLASWPCAQIAIEDKKYERTNNPPRGDRSAGFQLKFNIFH